jgi:hypothetical protein
MTSRTGEIVDAGLTAPTAEVVNVNLNVYPAPTPTGIVQRISV